MIKPLFDPDFGAKQASIWTSSSNARHNPFFTNVKWILILENLADPAKEKLLGEGHFLNDAIFGFFHSTENGIKSVDRDADLKILLALFLLRIKLLFIDGSWSQFFNEIIDQSHITFCQKDKFTGHIIE